MADWKEAARWYRARFRSAMQGIDHRTRLASAEHEKRVMLVGAMSELLPRMVIVGDWCRACDSAWRDAHRDGCAYIAALRAVHEAGKSVEVV